jgi:uncharacterized protein YeeX (DUF496 family)
VQDYFDFLRILNLLNRRRNENNFIREREAEIPSQKLRSNRKKIEFKDLSNIEEIAIDSNLSLESFKEFIKDIQDPLTGELINLIKNEYLYQCKVCSVFYLKESFEFIAKKNQGKCVSCSSKNIVPYFYDGKVLKIVRFDPTNVTLDNLHLFVGKSVIFTGKIIKILESRRGDYALMFEDKPWVEGFKLIIFYPLMKPGKGLEKEFLRSLVGKTITVRGLLEHHEIYGYEILIFKRNMILQIQ